MAGHRSSGQHPVLILTSEFYEEESPIQSKGLKDPLRTFPKRDLKFFGWSSRRVSTPPRYKEETHHYVRGDTLWEGTPLPNRPYFGRPERSEGSPNIGKGEKIPSQLTPKGLFCCVIPNEVRHLRRFPKTAKNNFGWSWRGVSPPPSNFSTLLFRKRLLFLLPLKALLVQSSILFLKVQLPLRIYPQGHRHKQYI